MRRGFSHRKNRRMYTEAGRMETVTAEPTDNYLEIVL
jgi:hypothetical protein